MIVVTAGTSEYRQIIDAQARKCNEYGYTHMAFDLGGLGIGEPYAVEREDLEPTVNGDSLPPATFKAALVQRALAMTFSNEVVCWLDADCIPLHPFDEFAIATATNHADWDAAVTLRPEPEVGLSNNPALDYLNSGVVWIRNTEAGSGLLEMWGKWSRFCGTDQGALNQIVAPEYRKVGWNGIRGLVHVSPCGADVLVLDCTEWNSWHPPFTGARIAHFKRGIRAQAVNYL
jgi:hypothetical protein